MKQILLTIFLILLIGIFAYAGMKLPDNATPYGTGFDILLQLSNLGDTIADSSADANKDLKIDRWWLDVYDSTGIDVDGGAFDYWLRPTYLREGSNVTFTVAGDTLTIAGSAGSGSSDTVWFHNDANTDSISSINNAIHLEWGTGIDATIVGDTTTVVVDKTELSLGFSDLSGSATDAQIPNNITIDISTDVETTGTKISTALQNRTTDTEFGKVTDDTTNWNTAYNWADTAQDSVRTWDNLGYPKATATTLGIASFSSASFTVTAGAVTIMSDGVSNSQLDESDNFTWTGTHDFGGAISIEIPNGVNPTSDAIGEVVWDSDDSAIEVFDGVISKLMPINRKFELVIWNPDLITDTISIFYVDSSLYQGGIKIVKAELQTSVDGTYALNLYEFSPADPPVFVTHIDTLNVGASDQRVQSITFTDSDIARGAFIYAKTPATDIDWIRISVIYYVKENN